MFHTDAPQALAHVQQLYREHRPTQAATDDQYISVADGFTHAGSPLLFT